MSEYIKEKKALLRDFQVWGKCTATDKARLATCTSEIQADNVTKTLIERYL